MRSNWSLRFFEILCDIKLFWKSAGPDEDKVRWKTGLKKALFISRCLSLSLALSHTLSHTHPVVLSVSISFLKCAFPGLFSYLFSSLLQTVNNKYWFNINCRWLYSNPGPQVSEATSLPTVPWPLPLVVLASLSLIPSPIPSLSQSLNLNSFFLYHILALSPSNTWHLTHLTPSHSCFYVSSFPKLHITNDCFHITFEHHT